MEEFNYDFLLVIAEKLLLDRHGRTDELHSVNASFMLVNSACKDAYLAQFTKMKFVDILSDDVKFYKDKNSYLRSKKRERWDVLTSFTNKENKSHCMLSKRFIAFLMQNGRFNPKALEINYAHNQWQPNKHDKFSPGLLSSESLLTILNLHKNLQIRNDNCLLNSVNIFDDGRYVDYRTIFSLNAKEFHITLDFTDYHCTKHSMKNITIFADRVERIFLTINNNFLKENKYKIYEDLYVDEWTQLFTFIFASCPALKILQVFVNFSKNEYDGKNILMDCLQKSLDAIAKSVLPNVYKICPPREDVAVDIHFCSSFVSPQANTPSQHSSLDLTKLQNFGTNIHSNYNMIMRGANFDRKTLKLVDLVRNPNNGAPETVVQHLSKYTHHTGIRTDTETEFNTYRAGCALSFAIVYFSYYNFNYTYGFDNFYYDYISDEDEIYDDVGGYNLYECAKSQQEEKRVKNARRRKQRQQHTAKKEVIKKKVNEERSNGRRCSSKRAARKHADKKDLCAEDESDF